MKKFLHITILTIITILILTACGNNNNLNYQNYQNDKKEERKIISEYVKLTPTEAKQIIDNETNYVILDVREQYEYDEEHIKNAKLLPMGNIKTEVINVIPNKDTFILVYCRSGNRSKTATNTLLNLGYNNAKDIGGIIDWPYQKE